MTLLLRSPGVYALAVNCALLLVCQGRWALAQRVELKSNVASASARSLESVKRKGVPRLHRAGDVYLGGQPTREGFAALKALGVKTIVTMRHQAETPEFNEQVLVESLNMAFVRLPWAGEHELTDKLLDKYRTLLRSVNTPTFVHCEIGNRVGAVWLVFRALDHGVSVKQSLKEAKTIGLRSRSYRRIALQYIKQNDTQ